MNRVVAVVFHPLAGAAAGPLESGFAAARLASARRHAAGFRAAGAEARIVEVTADGAPYAARLRAAADGDLDAGLVVLGSGSAPLARPADLADFVAAAASPGGPVLANNRYSADVVALPVGTRPAQLPDLPTDNALPRWLAEHGATVLDLRSRWRLQVDLDSPLDVLLTGVATLEVDELSRLRAAAAGVQAALGDPSAELLVAGRTSTTSLRWLERHTASRTRALIEERGMRTARPGQRPARSTLGLVLDHEGPAALGRIVAGLADAAVIDTRVLLAHRLGVDERRWPRAEDRFASDLLLADRIGDPWLRDLTAAAAEAPVPVLLGGHSLVGPGLRLLGHLVR